MSSPFFLRPKTAELPENRAKWAESAVHCVSFPVYCVIDERNYGVFGANYAVDERNYAVDGSTQRLVRATIFS